MKKRLLIAVSVVALALSVSIATSAQRDPRIGTWKLNVAKSTFSAGAPAPQSETLTVSSEASGGTITAKFETVNGDGSKREFSFDGTPDGKDHPYSGVPGGEATISVRRSGKTFIAQAHTKQGGKLLFTGTEVFSSGGKVMTMTLKGVNANGQSMNNVRVYDKQ